MTAKTLADLQVGDEVAYIRETREGFVVPSLHKITRVTRHQIVCGTRRYKIADGKPVDGIGSSVKPATSELVAMHNDFLRRQLDQRTQAEQSKAATEARRRKWLETMVCEIAQALHEGRDAVQLLRQCCEAWEHVE